MLVIAYLYRFSERQVEEATNYNLVIKEFVGLAVDEPAPDHSTLGVFNARLRASGGWEQFQAICDSVLQQACAAGIQLGKIQVVDSVHTIADVDNDADRQRQNHGATVARSASPVGQEGQAAQDESGMARSRRRRCNIWATRVTSA